MVGQHQHQHQHQHQRPSPSRFCTTGGGRSSRFMLAAAISATITMATVTTAFQPMAQPRSSLTTSTTQFGASLQTPPPASSSATKTTTLIDDHPISSSAPLTIEKQPPSHILTIGEMNPLFKFDKNGKQKVLNATGLYHLFVIVLTLPIWVAAMETIQWLGDTIEGFDPHRAKFDYSGKIWCRTYLRLTDCYPEIEGDLERLKVADDDSTEGTACMFVANHASFLDIPLLCCVLDPVFKFIAKDSLKKFPGVGKQLVGGEHVLIDRTNKRSQLKSFKESINYLKNGIPIMAFPEGARSPTGRLMSFKPGIFSMAVKANVPIVPLSLSNTYAVMPNVGFLPVQSGRGKLRVYVHDPISVEGKSEEEISMEVREALLSELPWDQHPLEGDEDEEVA